ncbi:hypothetical protein GGR13_000756 [Brevundimonas variabilis]|uniref:Uncharacterized protein n=2 Tax=Brevundimonas variabilis TaxID=74312 RepID=A0A7W9FF94_9CAUL|nr:hypothetical protein [Brevundimonas variabilis]
MSEMARVTQAAEYANEHAPSKERVFLDFVEFVGAPGSPQAGKPIFVNPEMVGIVVESESSQPGNEITAIECGGFPVLVAGTVEQVLFALMTSKGQI